MTFQCPYCDRTHKLSGQPFDSWRSVHMHTARCPKNDHQWIITTVYGPIHSTEYINLSTPEFKQRYPLADRAQGINKLRAYRIVDHDFRMVTPIETQQQHLQQALRQLIRERGEVPRARDVDPAMVGKASRLFGNWTTFVESCGASLASTRRDTVSKSVEPKPRCRAPRPEPRWNRVNTMLALRNLYRSLGSIQVSDCYGRPEVPSPRTINKLFGSWTEALQASGLPTQHTAPGRGRPTQASDGVTYRSQFEARFVDQFLAGRYVYEYECPYPNGQWLYDFYVPALDLYIELDGGLRPARMQEKCELNQRMNRRFLVVGYVKHFVQNELLDFLSGECS